MSETDLAKLVFKQVQTQLEKLGLKIKTAEAVLVDATIIESAARPNRLIEADLNEIESSKVLFGKPLQEGVKIFHSKERERERE